jgi:hypothetical protein
LRIIIKIPFISLPLLTHPSICIAVVYNIKSQRTRLVYITPQRDWGGKGLIGVTIRLDDYAAADERLLRVLYVEPSSPADVAGLTLSDYLLGTTTVSFSSDVVLASTLVQYEERPLEVYVYNTDSDTVRIVTLLPTYEWGGTGDKADGLLGAEVGMGYLHRFPQACRETDGVSVDINVVRTIAPRRPLSTSGEGDDEATEEEIIDLTREDKEDLVHEQQDDLVQEKQQHFTETRSQEAAPTLETEHDSTEGSKVQYVSSTSDSAADRSQSSTSVDPQEREKEIIVSQSAVDFFTNHTSPPSTVEAVATLESTSSDNTEKVDSKESSLAPISAITSEPAKVELSNPFRLRFPSMPFRGGTFTPPVSATNLSGAGDYFPPPPISNLDAGYVTSSLSVDGSTKMPPPPMFFRSVAPTDKQQIDSR